MPILMSYIYQTPGPIADVKIRVQRVVKAVEGDTIHAVAKSEQVDEFTSLVTQNSGLTQRWPS